MFLRNVFFSPEGSGGAREIGGMGEVTASDVTQDQLDLLGDDVVEDKKKPSAEPNLDIDDDEKPKNLQDPEEEEEKKAAKGGKEDYEDDEVEDENLEEVEEEEKVPETRISFKEINAKYPELLKDFPELRTIIAKEYQFSQVFPTVADAKDSLAKAEAYQTIDDSLGRGEAKPFIDSFKRNPEGFKSFLNNFVDELKTSHRDDYAEITMPAIKQILLASLSEGRNKGDTNLQKAALLIARNIWGSEYRDVLGRKEEQTPKPDPEKEDLKQQLEDTRKQSALAFHQGVYTEGMKVLDTVLKNGFLRTLKSKDFEGKRLTELQRDAISTKALRVMGAQLNKDKAHVAQMSSLRMKAEKAGFAGDWKARVTTAYLARAKNLLPAIQHRLIAAELNGVEDGKPKPSIKPDAGKDTSRPKPNLKNAKEFFKKGGSEEDFLAAD